MTLSGVAAVEAGRRDPTLAVVMTNDPDANQVKVYAAETGALIQTLSTHGKGGAGNNAGGVAQDDGDLVAAVNNGSNSVALFRRERGGLRFDGVVYTTSAPVSINFANDHMYVAGTTSVDSFAMHHGHVGGLDGTAGLVLAGGGIPPEGSTAQVGAISDTQLLVTLKSDPDPGTVDVVALNDGAVTPAVPLAVSAPDGTLAPFGFAVFPDGTAFISLAHSNQDGLFRDGAFAAVAEAGQTAPCWVVRVGKYVFTANTASRTLSRLVSTGSHIFVDSAIAANVPTGNPTDLAAAAGLLVAVDHGGGTSHLSFFKYNRFGELTAARTPVDIAVANANGVALMPPSDNDE